MCFKRLTLSRNCVNLMYKPSRIFNFLTLMSVCSIFALITKILKYVALRQ